MMGVHRHSSNRIDPLVVVECMLPQGLDKWNGFVKSPVGAFDWHLGPESPPRLLGVRNETPLESQEVCPTSPGRLPGPTARQFGSATGSQETRRQFSRVIPIELPISVERRKRY